MRVLWLCNIVLPVIARELGMEVSNKEGWISGMADTLLKKKEENGIELSVAFPVEEGEIPEGRKIGALTCYGFREDLRRAEIYDETLEPSLKKIVDIVQPDIVHCFGTEYPHTLAMCRVFPKKERLLVGVQGLCTLIAEAYHANLPEKVIASVTLRDWLRGDNLRQQQEKFAARGKAEREIISLAGNIAGRTRWDKRHVREWNPEAQYFEINESLRSVFYGPVWEPEKAQAHSVFMSQGDYPLKGLHYMLKAMPSVLEKYPDAKLYVAGNSLVSYTTVKEKLKLSAYGAYLRRLMAEGKLEEKVVFLGKLDAGQMLDRYLRSSLYVCASSAENSPNSLGEAMLLGMPCVCAAVGGIPSLFEGGKDGICYRGFQEPGEEELETISGRLADAVLQMWDQPENAKTYCDHARSHAARTHDRERNYQSLLEAYTRIGHRGV
jgi:glycosyltransferase involved in cell wall biosynthesis